MVDDEVIRQVPLRAADRLEHQRHLPRLLADLDDVALLDLVGRDVHPLAVHRHVAVVHELARGEHRRHEFRAVDHRVETALEQADQVLRRVALDPVGLGVDAAELLLGQIAVIALELLLGAQLRAEIAQLLLAALAVLAGAVFTLVHRGFRTAPDVLAHAAVDLVFGGGSLGHVVCSIISNQRRSSFAGNHSPTDRLPLAGSAKRQTSPPPQSDAKPRPSSDAPAAVNGSRPNSRRARHEDIARPRAGRIARPWGRSCDVRAVGPNRKSGDGPTQTTTRETNIGKAEQFGILRVFVWGPAPGGGRKCGDICDRRD